MTYTTETKMELQDTITKLKMENKELHDQNINLNLQFVAMEAQYQMLISKLTGKKAQNTSTNDTPVDVLLKEWLDTNPYPEFLSYLQNRVIGQENVKMIAACVYNYLDCIVNKREHNTRVILTSPSGAGKTETFRAIRDYFAEIIPELVIDQVDMSTITEEGFRGRNTDDIITRLFERPQDNGIGIIFLDEFDKKLLPSFDSSGTNINAHLQNQILTMLEGRDIRPSKKGEFADFTVNTGNTLFIALGAFDECRERKEKEGKRIGFGENTNKDWYDLITRQDILDIGGSVQLIGRFSLIINYHRLSDEAIDRIIESFVRKTQNELGVKIELSPAFRQYLHGEANSNFGCRMLQSIIQENALNEYITIMDENTKASVEKIKILDNGTTKTIIKRNSRQKSGPAKIAAEAEESYTM